MVTDPSTVSPGLDRASTAASTVVRAAVVYLLTDPYTGSPGFDRASTAASTVVRAAVLYRDIPDPDASIDERKTDANLEQLAARHQRVHGHDRDLRVVRQEEGERNGHHPAKEGIKEEGDPCFAPGADDEVGGVVERLNRHDAGGYAYEPCRCRSAGTLWRARP